MEPARINAMNRFFTLLLAASCLTAVGQEGLCDFESVGELTSYPYASQSKDWIYHESAGLIRAYCINNADDFSVVASDNWSTTLDEHDWDRCGFEFSSLRGDTILLAANTKPGYNDNYSAWRSVKLDVMSGEIISESDPMGYQGGPLMHDYLSDQCLYFSITSSYSLIKCWSPWTNELVWTLNMGEYNELYGVNRFGSYRSGESHDFFALWVNMQPMQIHSRHKDSGALVSVAVATGVADLFLVKLADGGDGVLALNTSTGDYQLFDGQLAELQSGHVNFFENESSSVRQIQTSDSVLSVVHTLPRNVNTPSGVSMYNDQDYACGVPDYIKVDYRIPDFELLQVCEYTPDISLFPTDANELHLAGENLLGFNAGPLNEDGTIWIASISSAAPSINGCPDLDNDGVCDNIDAVVPNYYCGTGTIWDEVTQTCIVANPSDSNFDGCVQLNDLLDLLSAYGDCGSEESPWQCGDPLEYQGYDYETVQIGEQCWFAENLRSENYRNGDSISQYSTDALWASSADGLIAEFGDGDAYCDAFWPNNACDEGISLDLYGRLYNGHSVADPRGLCPSGWKVPSDSNWQELELLGGMSVGDIGAWGHERGVIEQVGNQLKAASGWFGNNYFNENFPPPADSLGFRGLPGGGCLDSGIFVQAGDHGKWWASTISTDYLQGNMIGRGIDRNAPGIARDAMSLNTGLSIRCLKNPD